MDSTWIGDWLRIQGAAGKGFETGAAKSQVDLVNQHHW